MSAAPVLLAMRAARHCPHTGLSIPECSCRRCCEDLLPSWGPKLSRSIPSGALTTACDFAERMGVTVTELREFVRRQEVPDELVGEQRPT
jgi:hypothetical protein